MPISRPLPFTISEAPVPPSALQSNEANGAHVRFLGIVRALEGDRVLEGIDYSAYLPMAESALAVLREEATKEFGEHEAMIHHRTGFVPVGTASVVVEVATPHSAEAFALCKRYLDRLKKTVPIWKRPVFQDERTSKAKDS